MFQIPVVVVVVEVEVEEEEVMLEGRTPASAPA